jgi:hypothetical protein
MSILWHRTLGMQAYSWLSAAMISHRRVDHPNEPPHTKLGENGRVASRNWICDNTGDTIQGNVAHAEAPAKVINIHDMLLVGFRRKQHLEQPAPIRDLSDVANLGECPNTFLHD